MKICIIYVSRANYVRNEWTRKREYALNYGATPSRPPPLLPRFVVERLATNEGPRYREGNLWTVPNPFKIHPQSLKLETASKSPLKRGQNRSKKRDRGPVRIIKFIGHSLLKRPHRIPHKKIATSWAETWKALRNLHVTWSKGLQRFPMSSSWRLG